MIQNSTTIRLHPSRFDQLKALANSYGAPSVAQLIERLINEKIFVGDLPDVLPGLDIGAHGGRVSIAINGVGLPSMNVKSAQVLRTLLFNLRAGTHPEPGFRLEFADDMILSVSRVGRGFTLEIEDEVGGQHAKQTATPTMLGDLCRQIKSAIRDAEAFH